MILNEDINKAVETLSKEILDIKLDGLDISNTDIGNKSNIDDKEISINIVLTLTEKSEETKKEELEITRRKSILERQNRKIKRIRVSDRNKVCNCNIKRDQNIVESEKVELEEDELLYSGKNIAEVVMNLIFVITTVYTISYIGLSLILPMIVDVSRNLIPIILAIACTISGVLTVYSLYKKELLIANKINKKRVIK